MMITFFIKYVKIRHSWSKATCFHIQHDIIFVILFVKEKDEKSQNYKSITCKKRKIFTKKIEGEWITSPPPDWRQDHIFWYNLVVVNLCQNTENSGCWRVIYMKISKFFVYHFYQNIFPCFKAGLWLTHWMETISASWKQLD